MVERVDKVKKTFLQIASEFLDFFIEGMSISKMEIEVGSELLLHYFVVISDLNLMEIAVEIISMDSELNKFMHKV